MKITEQLKQEIDNMSYESMLSMWRFSPIGTPIFEGETGTYFSEIMRKKESELKPGEKAEISKNIGWK